MKCLSKRTIRFCIVSIFLIIIFVGILYAIRYGFEIERIEFVGEGMQAEFNEKLVTGNMIFFPSEKIRQEVLREYPQLKDIVITKKFPHTITIVPVLRSPFATLVTQNASYGIDEEGRVLSVGVDNVALSELHINPVSVRIGKIVDDKNVLAALRFLKQSKRSFPVSSIRTSEDGASLIAVSLTTEIFFTQDQDTDTLISTLQTIIAGVRIKGTMPKIIDVRFSKPVIQW